MGGMKRKYDTEGTWMNPRNVPKVRGQSGNPMCCMIPCAAQMNSKTGSRWEDSGWGLCKNGEWQLVNTGFSKHDDSTLGFKCGHVCTTACSKNHYTLWMVEESSRFNLWYQTTKRKQNDRHLLSVYKALRLILILHNKQTQHKLKVFDVKSWCWKWYYPNNENKIPKRGKKCVNHVIRAL